MKRASNAYFTVMSAKPWTRYVRRSTRSSKVNQNRRRSSAGLTVFLVGSEGRGATGSAMSRGEHAEGGTGLSSREPDCGRATAERRRPRDKAIATQGDSP